MEPDSVSKFVETCTQALVLPDTLRVLTVSNSSDTLLDWKTLIAVLVGGLLAIVGNFVLARIQRKAEIRKAFFEHHLDAYKQFSALCWKGHSVAIKDTDPRAAQAYPMAYEGFDALQSWLNEMVQTLDRLYLFIDDETYQSFQKLNAPVIQHLQHLRATQTAQTVDLATRDLGRDNVGQIQTLTTAVLQSCRKFLRDTYDAPLPESKK